MILLCALSCTAPAENNKNVKPNFLFILTDDQHRSDFNFLEEGIGPEGNNENLTPSIDNLARRGVILDSMYCPSPVCVPSRFNYLTGMYASRATNDWFLDLQKIHGHTFIHQEPKITSATPTIAKHLKNLGYRTGFVGKNHSLEVHDWRLLNDNADIHSDSIKNQLEINNELVLSAFSDAGFDYANRIFHSNPAVVGPKEISVHNLEWITEGALEFLNANGDDPFYLFYSVTVPHGPKDGWKMNPRATPIGILDRAPEIGTNRSSIPERLRKNNIHQSKADLLWLDDNIAVILEKLKKMKVLDNTIIVYVNDHGVESGKTTVYQGGMHTTAFMWGPEQFLSGVRKKSLTSTVDLGSTIVDFAGGDIDKFSLDGVSMRPLLTGQKNKVRNTVYGEMGHTRAVIKGDYKYIALRYSDYTTNMSLQERYAWLEAANTYMKKTGEELFINNNPNGEFGHSGFIPDGWWHEKEPMNKYPAFHEPDQLYNLKTDPNEQINLALNPKYIEILNEMKEELTRYLNKLPGDFAEFKQGSSNKQSNDTISAIAKRLRKVIFH